MTRDIGAPAWLTCLVYIVLYATVMVLALSWSRRASWRHLHTVALAGGVLLAYAWPGYLQPSLDQGNSVTDLIGNTVFAAIALVVLFFAIRRTTRFETQVAPPAVTSEPVRS